jgi:hypothetical protein
MHRLTLDRCLHDKMLLRLIDLVNDTRLRLFEKETWFLSEHIYGSSLRLSNPSRRFSHTQILLNVAISDSQMD